jgi:hypothetical protein
MYYGSLTTDDLCVLRYMNVTGLNRRARGESSSETQARPEAQPLRQEAVSGCATARPNPYHAQPPLVLNHFTDGLPAPVTQVCFARCWHAASAN